MKFNHIEGMSDKPKFTLFVDKKRKKKNILVRVLLTTVVLTGVFLFVRLFAITSGTGIIYIPVVDDKLIEFNKFLKWRVAPHFK